MVEYGSCNMFADYSLVGHISEPKVLRSEYEEFKSTAINEGIIDNNASEFYLPGRFAAIAADKKSTQSIWFVHITSEEETNNESFAITDDYGRVVGPGVSFYKCEYMEVHCNSRKGTT